MENVKISLIMSVYNGEDYLAEAIDSVLGQTFTDWECIIINDCSTDSTAEILERYAQKDARIRIHTNEVNLRLPKSLNKAIELARGKYIARMDADDICLPDRLEKQFAFMETHGDIALSSCRFMTLKNGQVQSGGCGGIGEDAYLRALLLVANPILHPGVIAKAEVMKSLRYDTNLTCTEDLELWTRFVMQGHKMQILPEYLMLYRLHDKQITQTTFVRQQTEVLSIIKTYFAATLEDLPQDLEEFYIRGVYFTHERDIKKLLAFYRWLKKANAKTRTFAPRAIDYAVFEVLAEYKRSGLAKKDLLCALAHFPLGFVLAETVARKQRAKKDGLACIEAAKRVGYAHTGGDISFPQFSKAK